MLRYVLRCLCTAGFAGLTALMFYWFASGETPPVFWLGLGVAFAASTLYRLIGDIWPDADLFSYQWWRQWPYWSHVFVSLLAIVAWGLFAGILLGPGLSYVGFALAYPAAGFVYAWSVYDRKSISKWDYILTCFGLPAVATVAASRMWRRYYQGRSVRSVLGSVFPPRGQQA